jgi:hypothetical protein
VDVEAEEHGCVMSHHHIIAPAKGVSVAASVWGVVSGCPGARSIIRISDITMSIREKSEKEEY